MTDLELAELSRAFVKEYDLISPDPVAVFGILEAAPCRSLKRDDVLFREREPGNAMYFLLSGRIRVTKDDIRGAPQRVAMLRAPSIVGHMSLVDEAPRNATCVVREPTVVAELGREAFRLLYDSDGPRGTAIRHLVLSAMSEQLSEANRRIRSLIDPATAALLDDETAEQEIEGARDALQGWKGPKS